MNNLTRAEVHRLIDTLPDRAFIDGDVIVYIFVQDATGAWHAAAPQSVSWMEALAEVNGIRPLAKRRE